MGRPDYLEVFMAYVDGQAVSVGWTRYQPASDFASLWGGATLPTHREQGLYTSVLAARLQAARRRGRRYVFVEAEPASERILRRHGFYELTTAFSCAWRR
jgi:GNAT superfamily N-acetyltransferase